MKCSGVVEELESMDRFLKTFKRIGRAALVLLSLWLLVGPTALLQLTAWGWMIVSYSSEEGLRTGVTDTFSGEKPCELCHFVEGIERPLSEESDRPTPTETREIKLVPGPDAFALFGEPSEHRIDYATDDAAGQARAREVPRPPPRVG